MKPLKSQVPSKETLQEPANNSVCKSISRRRTPPMPQPCWEFRYNQYWFLRKKARPIDLKVINLLIGLSKQYNFIYISQKKMAAIIDMTREEVNRSIQRIVSWGLLTADYRHMRTSVYRITSLFSLPKVIVNLSRLLKNLIVNPSAYFNAYLTQSIKSSSKCKNYTKSYSKKEREFYKRLRQVTRNSEIINKRRKSILNLAPVVWIPKKCQLLGHRQRMRWMNNNKHKELVDAIKQLSLTLNLSTYGESKLSVFPVIAICYAEKELIKFLKKGLQLKRPFNFVYSKAEEYCKNASMYINDEMFDRLKEKYKFTGKEKETFGDIDYSIYEKREPVAIKSTPTNTATKIYKLKEEPTYNKEHEEKGFKQVAKYIKKKRLSFLDDYLKVTEENILTRAA